MTETKSPKKKGLRRKRKSTTARLREAKAELQASVSALALEKDRGEMLIRGREELRETMQSRINALKESLESAQHEARVNRDEYERFSQYYNESDEARRNTRQALEVVFAALAPGTPTNKLLEVLESVGTELLDGHMDTVRPILIEGLAQGAAAGIPLFAKHKEQEKMDKEKAEAELAKVGFLASLLGDKHTAPSGGFGDLLGAMMNMCDPTQGDPFSEGCGRSDCPSCGGR